MIGNQSQDANRGLRLYGQNERASSTSSGPKWTSSITDLLVNRGGAPGNAANQMRYKNNSGANAGMVVSQSHQTSQHQLLTHQQAAPSSSAQHLHNISGGGAPQTSEGSRLMMKLMNNAVVGNTQQLSTHHQPSISSMSGMPHGGSTFDHPRLSGSRDDQKRLALDECTNYLQQKTMQQHFPSTSMAISNIINSNRSASSAGIQAQQQQQPSGSSTSAAAKKFQAFKFNLTLNKNKALGATKDSQQHLQNQQQYSSNAFYQAQQNADQQQMQDLEDQDAMVISEKHKKQIQALSRGSSQLAMKQHLKQMIKSYEDQPQLNTDGTQRFDYHQTQQIPSTDQQLTYDTALRSNVNPSGQTLQQPTQNAARIAPGSASSSSKGKPIEKKVHEMEERQKIFEEEIIKRVKEIQTYAKTLHMHLKKLQQSQNKKTEDHQMLKDEVTLQIKDLSDIIHQQRNHHQSEISEQKVNDMVGKSLKILDSEVALQIEHLEQKLVKDYDAKIARLTKNTQAELQLKTETLRDEIFSEISQSIKADMRQLTDKLNKVQDKALSDFTLQLSHTQNLLESSQQTISKDLLAKHDKLQKLIKDIQTNSDDTIGAMTEALRNEMEQMKKKVQGELKNEIAKVQMGERETKEQMDQLDQRIQKIETMLEKQGSPQKNVNASTAGSGVQREEIQSLISELQESLEDQIGQVANEFTDHVKTQQSKNDQIKQVQEAYLQLKQHLSSTTLTINDKQAQFESQIRQNSSEINQIRQDLQEVTQIIQGQDDTKIDAENIADQVLDQVKPDIENLNEVTAQISEQLETLKLELSKKSQKSEVQDIKKDVEESIQHVKKLIEKKIAEVETYVSSLHGDLDSLVEATTNAKNKHIDKIGKLKQTLAQLSADIQSKTDDLYDQLKELEERVGSVGQQQSFIQNTSQQETTPERKSRVEALAALRASLENQMNDINERIDNMIETRAGDKHDTKSAIEVIQNQVQSIESSITDKVDSMIDDKLDTTIAKVNELDSRVSKIEEKEFQSPDKHKNVGLTTEEVDEKIQSAQNDLQLAIDTAMEQLTEFENKLEQNQEQRKEEVENIKADIQSLRELNACLQDVMVTQEDYSQFKAICIQPEALQEKLDKIKSENAQLCLDLQNQIEGVKEAFESQEERIKILETRKFIKEGDQEINFLSSPRQNENNQRAQGHFLEDLSEAISSQNNQVNRTGTDGGDMLFFNNQTQSVGRNSMMSNRLANLVSPIVDRNFQFNSQVSGIAPRVLLETTPSATPNHQQQTVEVDDQQSHEETKQQVEKEQDQEEEQSEEQSQPDVFDTESPQKEDPALIKSSSQPEDDEDGNNLASDEALMQEINISLESPREEEKGHTPERTANEHANHRSINSQSASRQQLQQLNHTKQSPPEVVQHEESNKSQDKDEESEMNEIGSEFERGESIEEIEEEKKQSSDNEELSNQQTPDNPNVQLLSPAISQVPPVTNPVHHPLGAQPNHFVAFESDEEEVQQYDLLPISNASNNSRNNQGGPHGTSSQAAVIPAAPHQHHAVRNRYFESGSGDEELVQEPNAQELLNNNDDGVSDNAGGQLDNFNVQFQDRNQDPEEEGQGFEPVESQREDDEVNEEEKDAEFDDSPFDAASSQRFDQRFEDETDVRRPITSLAGRNLREQLEEDPEIQHIHHETLSSHRTSEMSENNQPDVDISRRSGSPNLDHNNDNILGEDQDEEDYNPLPSDLEESKIDNVAQSQSVLDALDDLQDHVHLPVQQIVNPKDNILGESANNDDWNLEDVTERKDIEEGSDEILEEELKSDKQSQQQNKDSKNVKEQQNPLPSQLSPASEESKQEDNSDSVLKSQIVANWIIENEIAKCIEAALSMRSRTWQQEDLNQSEEEDGGMAEW